MNLFLSLLSIAIGCCVLFGREDFFVHANNNNNNNNYGINDEALYLKLKGERDLFTIESTLAQKEHQRFQQLFRTLNNQGYEIHGFYHTSKWRDYWANVIAEQLYLLDGKRKLPFKQHYHSESSPGSANTYDSLHSKFYDNLTLPYASYEWDINPTHRYASLLNLTNELHINIVGENTEDYKIIKTFVNSLDLKHKPKISFNFNKTIGRWAYGNANAEKKKELDRTIDLSTGEYSTVTQLHQYCKKANAEGRKAIVYYIHNKGTCCVKNEENIQQSNPVANWREYMNTMNLEFPSICLRAILNKKYLACGVENQDGHFSGNFWYADCAHVALLTPLRNRYDFGESEFFVLRGHAHDGGISRLFGFKCAYSIFNCGLNLYDYECTRSKYRSEILLKSIAHKLTPNNVYKQDDFTGKCRELVKKRIPYEQIAKELSAVVTK